MMKQKTVMAQRMNKEEKLTQSVRLTKEQNEEDKTKIRNRKLGHV